MKRRQIGHGPFGAIYRENSDPVSGTDIQRFQSGADRSHFGGNLGETPTFPLTSEFIKGRPVGKFGGGSQNCMRNSFLGKPGCSLRVHDAANIGIPGANAKLNL